MEYEILVNNPWQENTVVLYDGTGEAAIVDCGCFTQEERQRLEDFLAARQLKPVLLLDTHLHPDHVFGNGFMKERYGLLAQASQADEPLLAHAPEYAAMLGLRGMEQPPALGAYLWDGDRVKFGASELEVIAVPGHSPGGLCYAGSVGRADLPGGDARALIEGIKNKLMCLPDGTKVIAGHGGMTTIGEERKYNPFLR